MTAAQQLTFDLPPRVSLGPEDFFVSDANAQAFAMVTAPDRWPDGKLALVGPHGSGKSHLARVFAQQTNATVLQATDLGPTFRLETATDLVIEDLDALRPDAEEALFHLHNFLRNRGRLLLTAQHPPARWPLAMPDLISRMQATTVTQIADPDDKLLLAVLLKQFQDRQIAPPPDLPPFIAARLERSFAAVADIVDRLDRTALREGRKVSVRMVARLLDPVDSGPENELE